MRDLEGGARTADDIDGDVRVAHLDLADQASVKAFAAAWDGPLHVLVNNAGVMAIQELTRTGYASAGVARYALDPANAERLWEDWLRMLG